MKNILKITSLIMLILFCFGVNAQDTITVEQPTAIIPALEQWFDLGMIGIMTALTVVFGYLGKWFPGLNLIKDTELRLIAFVVLLGAGYFFYGGNILEVAFAYIGATQLYDKFFKVIFGGSPKNDGGERTKSKLAA